MAIKLRTGQISLEQRAVALAMFNKLVAESFSVLSVTAGISGRLHGSSINIPWGFAPAMRCTSPSHRSMVPRCIRSTSGVPWRGQHLVSRHSC